MFSRVNFGAGIVAFAALLSACGQPSSDIRGKTDEVAGATAPVATLTPAEVFQLTNNGGCDRVLATPIADVQAAPEEVGLLKYHYGVCHMSAAQYDEAAALLRDAVGTDAPQFWVHYNLGAVYLAQQKKNEAITELQQALALDSTSDRARQLLAAARAS